MLGNDRGTFSFVHSGIARLDSVESNPDCTHNRARTTRRGFTQMGIRGGVVLLALLSVLGFAAPPAHAEAKPDPSEICLSCHGDKKMSIKQHGQIISLYVDGKKFAGSVHAAVSCTGCHSDLSVDKLPHDKPKRVECGSCHSDEGAQYAKSMHGRAVAHGNPLAPRCVTCHGNHDIVPVTDKNSVVWPLNVPFVCGGCHKEGTPVQKNLHVDQHNILANYTESIHGEALLKKGLVVAANCASCHTAHDQLPHTDPESSINRRNIAKTCTKCHAGIEGVHRKIIRGELWEKAPNELPACVDCHAPHKIRNVFYEQGMADADCMICHGKQGLKASNGRSMFVNQAEVLDSRHATVACAQCHSEVNVSKVRPCATITHNVDCTKCHAEIGQEYQKSTHGQLYAKNNPNAPFCTDCHGTHHILGKQNQASMTFPTNVPTLCGKCHRDGEKAAVRYTGTQHDIIKNYIESIHGKGLLQSGLTVTAMCTSCHTAHGQLPASDPNSTVNPKNVPNTCGQCHHGIEQQFNQSVHSRLVTKTNKPLPVCSDCHTAHQIRRTDAAGFRLEVMSTCGQCHQKDAETYFDTYHGKVSRLGYAKTAKCFDCHGAHDILPVSNPKSRLSYANVVQTCHQCHAGANRRFAGYLTHATHHDPEKYAVLYWVFWSMTGLLVGTFIVGGVHTLLWLPRAFQMRRELREEEAREAAEAAAQEASEKEGDENGQQ
jgi:Class III cytochrome C family